jgi:uncharacterized OB-fold protein
MITCPNCGRRNTNEARNCDNCGTALKEEQTERTELQISSVELPASQSIQSDNATNQSIEQSPGQQIYCSNCGQKLSADANFCWKCGKEIKKGTEQTQHASVPHIANTPNTSAPIQWEYNDFVYTWSHKDTWYRTSSYNDTQVRVDVWMNYQSRISAALQKWYDEGWQPVGEVGPSSIKIHQYTQWDGTAAVVWTIFTAGLALLIAPFLRESFTEPTEFRLQMRRPRTR